MHSFEVLYTSLAGLSMLGPRAANTSGHHQSSEHAQALGGHMHDCEGGKKPTASSTDAAESADRLNAMSLCFLHPMTFDF